MTPQELEARVLYRDGLVIVLDKPAGLPVHAGPGRGPNLEMYLEALRYGLPQRPHLAHRLDRDTSGCLVLGRHREALSRLGRLFATGRVEKTYWAVAEGQPPADEGVIDLPLAKRSTSQRGWWMKVDPEHGQPAVTDYRVLGRGDGLSWLELRPRTGRTHQIRVHLQALGCPVLGDPAYGRRLYPRAEADVPLHLHARSIAVPLYPNRDPIRVTAPPPPHMLQALELCGYGQADVASSAEMSRMAP